MISGDMIWLRQNGGRIGRVALLLVFALCLLAPVSGHAASGAERRAFALAATLLNDAQWDLAERQFAEFNRLYPNSDRRAEAFLLQAQARYKLKNFGGVVELLQTQTGAAGNLADEYLFWIAEAHFQNQQYPAAAAAYARILKDFPKSHRRIEASYGEAFCRFKLKEFARVRELLGDPKGDFQELTRDKLTEDLAVQGYLLLAETLLLQKEPKLGEQSLARLNPDQLKPELAWRRQYLLCRLQLADARPQEALAGAARLLTYAEAAKQKPLLAESVVLQAGIYEQLNQPEAAVAAYEKNLSDIASPEQRRQALLKVIELTMGQGKVLVAVQKLEAFSILLPNDPAQDLAQLTLGELKLKQYVASVEQAKATTNGPALGTNWLQAALGHFDRVVTDYSQSPLAGKAYLNRGWCHWLQGNIENSQPSFRQAVERLPVSLDQASARYKLGDTYIWQKDYTNALVQFRRVLSDYADLSGIKDALLDQALYQILRACIATGDLEGAHETFQKITAWYPESYYSDRSMLVLGQALNRVDHPSKARAIFAELVKRFPQSPLVPEAELAMARTFVQENRWDEAIVKYNAWAANEAARSRLPQADFDRAWVHYKAGQETNALRLFTAFVTDFPTNALAPQAQFWVAGHFFRQGDLTNAEANYQLVFQNTNWPVAELTYQARMMAGRAALARQSTKDATNYFLSVINDQGCPTNILIEAYFAYGDTLIELPALDPGNVFAKFSAAIGAFAKIPQAAPASPLTPAAFGRLGDCYLQLAVQDAKYYDNAAENYLRAMTNALDVAVRSQAEVGVGLVREKQAAAAPVAQREALLAEAFDHYRNVFYGANLRDGETAAPFWLKKAALAAAAIRESAADFEGAVVLYQRLKSVAPALADFCDRKIKLARERTVEKSAP